MFKSCVEDVLILSAHCSNIGALKIISLMFAQLLNSLFTGIFSTAEARWYFSTEICLHYYYYLSVFRKQTGVAFKLKENLFG